MTSLLLPFLLISFFSTGVALLLGWRVFQLRYLPAFWASAIVISLVILPYPKGFVIRLLATLLWENPKHHHNGIDVAAPLGTPLHTPEAWLSPVLARQAKPPAHTFI